MAYSDTEKAESLTILASCENDYSRAVAFLRNHCGIRVSEMQLRRWHKGEFVNEDVTTLSEEKKEALADRLETLAHKIVDVAPGRMEDASFVALMTGLGIAVDKFLLLKGQANTIHQTNNLTDEERLQRLQELTQRVRERQQAMETKFEEIASAT